MTDRHTGYLVALEAPIREDDAQGILFAIRQIRGVLSVEPIVGGDVGDLLAEARRDSAWRDELIRVVQDGPNKERKR